MWGNMTDAAEAACYFVLGQEDSETWSSSTTAVQTSGTLATIDRCRIGCWRPHFVSFAMFCARRRPRIVGCVSTS